MCFGTIPAGPKVVAKIIREELYPVIKGEDPFFVKRIRDRMWRATEYHGVTGVVQFGIAAVDNAIWDIVGRALDKPLYKILGGFRDRVAAYAMVGWYYDDAEDFKKRCVDAVEEGFRAIKLKVGMGSLADDISRIKTARKAVGDKVELMVDANQDPVGPVHEPVLAAVAGRVVVCRHVRVRHEAQVGLGRGGAELAVGAGHQGQHAHAKPGDPGGPVLEEVAQGDAEALAGL